MIPDNHFDVREELPLNEFLNYDAANSEKISFNECVHIIPERREGRITVYRLVGDTESYPGNYERIRTVIENVRFDETTFGSMPSRDVANWCFQQGDGETVLTFLSALKVERSPAEIKLTYYEKNSWPALDETPLENETFMMEYETESGRGNAIQIHNTHSGHDVNYNANFKFTGKNVRLKSWTR